MVPNGCTLPSRPVPAVERMYSTVLYATDIDGVEMNDQYVYFHPNGLAIVGLAPTHPLVRLASADGPNGPDGAPSIVSVDMDLGKGDRVANVSGKHKKGASLLQADSILCKVQTSSGPVHKVRCCIAGGLLELNRRLEQSPQLLTGTSAASDGYIAILRPRSQDVEEAKQKLLSREQYKQLRKL